MEFHRMFIGVFTLAILFYVPTFGSEENIRKLISRNTFNIKNVQEEIHDLWYDIQNINKTCALYEELVDNAKESKNDVGIETEPEIIYSKSKLKTNVDVNHVLNGFADLKLEMQTSMEQIKEDQICVINKTEHIESNLKTLEIQLKTQTDQTRRELLHIEDKIENGTHIHRDNYGELKLSINSLQTEIQSVEEKSESLSSETQSLRDDVNDVHAKYNSFFQLFQTEQAQRKKELLHMEDLIDNGTQIHRDNYSELKLSMNSLQTEIQSIEKNSKRLSSEIQSLRGDMNDVQEKFQRELTDLKKCVSFLYELSKPNHDWEYFKGSLYMVSRETRDYNSATSFCKDQNSYLAVITSEEENKFLSEYIRSMSIKSVLIGGDDMDREGHWKWTSNEQFHYTNWNSGEPNNDYNKEDCLMMYSNGKWNDNDCSVKEPFICEIKI